MSFTQRTHDCGALRAEHAGQTVTVNGWAHRVRDLGGLLFVDLRDRTGLVQLFIDPAKAPDLRNETCLSVTGTVKMRDERNRNPNMPTGDVELEVTGWEVLSTAGVLPFPVSDESQMVKVNEELRVKYRYLDLRRPSMYRNLALRAGLISGIRSYLDARGFLEVETPIFTKSTPEGARDYLIPYRLEPGKFYALPQSPQQYKQLLMVSGIERYYQIAKCFRDEAQRADRQPEFTQLDLEMSFVTQEDVLQIMEGLVRTVVNDVIDRFGLEKDKIGEFPRMTYDEAVRRYGSDKPDTRFGLELFDVSDLVTESGFGVFKQTVASEGQVKGVRYPGGAKLSRKEVAELEDLCKSYRAKGMASVYVEDPESEVEGSVVSPAGRRFRGSIVKFFDLAELDAIAARAEAESGDLLCFVADMPDVVAEALNRLRLHIGTVCGLRDKRKLNFLYVIDFPLVEWNAENRSWTPSHHPFTSPKIVDMQYIDNDPGRMRADCYDLVCNGTEMASGSIRIHQPEVQARIFKLIGVDEQQQQERFAHILEAFSYGAPPHGGMAPGIDRLVAVLLDEENIREVIAFPKMGNGYDPLMDSPSTIDEAQWQEVGLQVRPSLTK
jgi:aspartyl-tRNA synthetase